MTDVKRPTKSAKIEQETSGVEDENSKGSNHKETDESAQLALEKIVNIQHEIDKLNEQASEEILHVEQKYNQLRKPHYQDRAKLAQQIPEFWYTTLTNHTSISQLLNEEDEQALLYLESIKVDEFEDVKSGFQISFHFRPNPYFEDPVLSKEFTLDENGENAVIGSAIQWKPGRDLTSRPDTAQEMKGRKRNFEEPPSFFCWFSDCNPNESDELAEFIKDEIWPNPLQFFLHGEVSIDEAEEEEEEDEDEQEEVDQDDELVDLDEDEEEDAEEF